MKLPSAFDLLAPFYDTFFSRADSLLSTFRERYVPLISGTTLDLAVGTGPNIEHYPDKAEVTLMDLSAGMLRRARRKADQAMQERPGLKLTLVQCALEQMPFKDCSFDTVLSIDVFCSCRDLDRAMDETYRVLKPGGKAIFVEHFRTGRRLTDLMLSVATYLFSWPLFGIYFNRPIGDSIRKRFNVQEHELLGRTFQAFVCVKPPTMRDAAVAASEIE